MPVGRRVWVGDGPSPRQIIPNLEDVQPSYLAWVKTGTNEHVIGMFGVNSGYIVAGGIEGYAPEARRAWKLDRLDADSTTIAQAFWMYAQEMYIEDHAHAGEPMDAAMAEQFRAWNISAGKREVDGLVLPWHAEATSLIVDGTLHKRGSEQVKGALKKDLAQFRAYRRAVAAKPGEDETSVLPSVMPEDLTAAVEITDPRVRHLWVEAANVSRDQDMCNTYDVIARKTGVPSRAVLKRTGELQPMIKITMSAQLSHMFPNPDRRNGTAVYNGITPEEIRQWLAETPDDKLKDMFRHYDTKDLV